MPNQQIYLAVLAAYLVMSLLTLTLFWRDKRAAQKQHWRTPEKSLLLLALLGGWPGAILGMRFFRHKNRKPIFRFGVPLIAGLHLAAWIVLGFAIVNDAISS